MFRQLVNAVSRKASAAKLPSVGSWLNASKPESMLDRDDYLPSALFAATIASANATINNQNIALDKSFADDLNMKRGIVSSRVALLLRSTEVHPVAAKMC